MHRHETVVVLANLAEAEPGRFTDDLAALLEPKLAKRELAPIADGEPRVTARLRELLAAAARGALRPEDFAYVRAGFFPAGARRLETTLKDLGSPATMALLERVERGDDRIYTYDAFFSTKVLRVVLALAPDDKVAQLSARPR